MDGFTITPARPGDEKEVFLLYRSLLGTPGCTWNQDYPSLELVAGDIARGSLYCLRGPEGELWGAASAGEDDPDIRPLTCWNQAARHSCELARVGIRRDLQGKGLARELVLHILKDAPLRGFDTIRLLVSRENPAALALYRRLGFVTRGKVRMYGVDWLCQEKDL